jgi:iron complex transport system substrate-binding protein
VNVEALLSSAPKVPQRIACMTEESVETLFRIGAGDLVVGVSAFTKRPVEAQSRPRISSFLDANFDKLLSLQPDLVIGFSDLQADIARELVKRGVAVWIQNQRSVAEILQCVRVTGAIVGKASEANALADDLVGHVREVAARGAKLERKPRVYFEEWPDPAISAIRWVSELIEIAGGVDIFSETRARHDAKGRVVDLDEVVQRKPDVVIASWCGKRVDGSVIRARRGFEHLEVHEIESELILQPGPAALTEGLDELHEIIASERSARSATNG